MSLYEHLRGTTVLTPSTRVVSRNDGRGWSQFRFRGRSDRVGVKAPRLSHVDPLTAASTASTASRQRRHRIKFKVNFNTLTKHATLFFDVM